MNAGPIAHPVALDETVLMPLRKTTCAPPERSPQIAVGRLLAPDQSNFRQEQPHRVTPTARLARTRFGSRTTRQSRSHGMMAARQIATTAKDIAAHEACDVRDTGSAAPQPGHATLHNRGGYRHAIDSRPPQLPTTKSALEHPGWLCEPLWDNGKGRRKADIPRARISRQFLESE